MRAFICVVIFGLLNQYGNMNQSAEIMLTLCFAVAIVQDIKELIR